MAEMADRSRTARVRLAGACWALAAIIYLVTEAVAAHAYTPAYSYLSIVISALGVPGCHAVSAHAMQCSPLAALMNGGFVVEGILFVAAVALLFGVLRARSRFAFAWLGVAHGIGICMVALFHAGPGALSTRLGLHVIGAALAIICGNLAIRVSPAPRELQSPAFIQSLTRWAPVIGIVAVLLMAPAQFAHGMLLQPPTWERVSVYTIVLWEGVFGLWLLWTGGRVASRG